MCGPFSYLVRASLVRGATTSHSFFFGSFTKKVVTRGISQRANTRVQRALFHALSVADEHRAQYAFVTHVWHECKAARAPLSAARRPAPLQAICLTKVELPCRLTSRCCRLGKWSGIRLCCPCLILQVGREACFSMASHHAPPVLFEHQHISPGLSTTVSAAIPWAAGRTEDNGPGSSGARASDCMRDGVVILAWGLSHDLAALEADIGSG